ncbi:MAG: flavin reductase family protein [Solirubrobacterales bacterium]|nr:flavin reductase family protein [Solirubrobacterales bacterium]
MTAPEAAANHETPSSGGDAGGSGSARVEEQPADVSRKEELRVVMGCFATGAAIITAVLDDEPHGLVVNSFTSVSLDPPLILFCPGKSSATWPAIETAGQFVVNILAADQETLCRKFSKKGEDRFSDGTHAMSDDGGLILDDIVAFLWCRVEQVHDAGDHFITVGRVLDLGLKRDVSPLVFYKGAYHNLAGFD